MNFMFIYGEVKCNIMTQGQYFFIGNAKLSPLGASTQQTIKWKNCFVVQKWNIYLKANILSVFRI